MLVRAGSHAAVNLHPADRAGIGADKTCLRHITGPAVDRVFDGRPQIGEVGWVYYGPALLARMGGGKADDLQGVIGLNHLLRFEVPFPGDHSGGVEGGLKTARGALHLLVCRAPDLLQLKGGFDAGQELFGAERLG